MKNVVNNALLMCSGGTVPTPLTVTSQFVMSSDGNLVATKLDSAPFVNIKPFGICGPQSGKYPHPCNLCLVGSWLGANETVLVNGGAALLQGSKIACAFGMISIVQPGQFTMMMGQPIPSVSLSPIRIESVNIELERNEEQASESNQSSEGEGGSQGQQGNTSATSDGNANSQNSEESESNEDSQEERSYRAELKVEYKDGMKPVNMVYKAYDSGNNLLAEGVLDENGEALLEGLPTDEIRVEYGEDEREEIVEDEIEESSIYLGGNSVDRAFVEKGLDGIEEIKREKNLKVSEEVSSLAITWIWKEVNNGFAEGRRAVDIFFDISLAAFAKKEHAVYADVLLTSLLYLAKGGGNAEGNNHAWSNLALLSLYTGSNIRESEKYILALTAVEGQIKKSEIYPRIRRLARMNPESFIDNLVAKDLVGFAKRDLEVYIDYFKNLSNYLPGNYCNNANDIYDKFKELLREAEAKMQEPIDRLKEELRNVINEEQVYSIGKQYVSIEGVEE